MHRVFVCLLILPGATSPLACDAPSSEGAYRVAVRVTGDPGRPLSGAEVSVNERIVGASDEHGLVKMNLRGVEGTTRTVRVQCPEGHQQPKEPLNVLLRRASDSGQLPEYEVSCLPRMRRVVVAIRAEKAPGVPVTYLGQQVAETDAHGAAHFFLQAEPSEAIRVRLDTSSLPQVEPQDPAATFLVENRDEIFVFAPDLVVGDKKEKPAPRVAHKPKHGPVRIH